MANVIFKLVNDSTETTEAIENGKLLYNYQSKKINLDQDGARITFYDFIGLLTSLTTTAKDTIVNAINELVTKTNTTNSNLGALSSLTTTVKTSLVNAINEINAKHTTVTTYAANGTTVKKQGNIVTLNYEDIVSFPNGFTTISAVIPIGSRPLATVNTPIIGTASGVVYGYGLLIINTDGTIKAFTNTTIGVAWTADATYLL